MSQRASENLKTIWHHSHQLKSRVGLWQIVSLVSGRSEVQILLWAASDNNCIISNIILSVTSVGVAYTSVSTIKWSSTVQKINVQLYNALKWSLLSNQIYKTLFDDADNLPCFLGGPFLFGYPKQNGRCIKVIFLFQSSLFSSQFRKFQLPFPFVTESLVLVTQCS